jgi:mannose-6-phosphate isomerase-like protein (cupin superfamily)
MLMTPGLFARNVGATRDTDVYTIYDLTVIDDLGQSIVTLSRTDLKPRRETRGHSHAGQRETYYFWGTGSGIMILGEEEVKVGAGVVVDIPDGVFHKVINQGDETLSFYCTFNGAPGRPSTS